MRKKKIKTLQAPKGSYDILPQDQAFWIKFSKIAGNLAQDYGYQKIETPLLEDASLFAGDTEVINQQSIKVGGVVLALRPNATFGIVRSYLQEDMSALMPPLKFFYTGSIFENEKNKSEIIRQTHKFGLEVIGEKDPIIDAQIIQFCFNVLKALGLKKINIQINSAGCSQCRLAYRRGLIDYYRSKKHGLCQECRQKIKENPWDLLACQEEKCQPLKSQAPVIVDYLCEDCHQHFRTVLELLDGLETPYFLDNSLTIKGNYRTKTVFTVVWEGEPAARVLASGGRYDNLVRMLGGKATPMVGAMLHIEEVVALMKKEQVKAASPYSPKVFLAQLGDLGKKKSLKLFEVLHQAGIVTAEALSRDSIKTQLHGAEKLGTPFALIMGQQEALEGTIIIRDMPSGVQETVSQEKVVDEIKKRLKR